jgi:hypothetical protein
MEAVRRLAAVEAQAVAASGTGAAERVSGSVDEAAKMLELAGQLGQAAGRSRRQVKARTEALRRLVRRYEEDLGLDDPAPGRWHRLASGREVIAVEWVGPEGVREVEPP